MEQRRLDLQSLLEELLGSRNVYFQPPESIRMQYPAIVYSREDIEDLHANNEGYKRMFMFTVTVIDPDPDSEIVEKVANLKYCSLSRHFTKDDLNHDIFRLYF
jgi:hypothetical protein